MPSADGSDTQDAAAIIRISLAKWLLPVIYALAAVALTTAIMLASERFVALSHVGIGYVIPVMLAATQWGVFPAIVAAVASVGASAFFFYAPIYSLQVHDPQELVDLAMFVIVAVVTGQLATLLRHHVEAGHRREETIKALYFLSRRLAAISSEAEIYGVIEEHLSATTGCRAVLFEAGLGRSRLEELAEKHRIPDPVRRAIFSVLEEGAEVPSGPVGGTPWLIRTLPQRRTVLGLVAILQPRGKDPDAVRQQIDGAFAEAAATLERIDVVRAIDEARLRSQGDVLRDALMGSVSHELRTPLASIIGPASILVEAPAVAADPRLLSMASLVRDQAERLDGDISNLLDASRISGSGVRAQPAWTDVLDVVNAALERRRARLQSHRLETVFEEDLPLIFVDPMLVKQALSQIIDNAAKYSPSGSMITITVRQEKDWLTIAVTDEGSGLSADEQARICERFYRAPRQAAAIGGSGLGLWIARSFVTACGGRLEARSAGPDRGLRMEVSFPVVEQGRLMSSGGGDE